MIADTILKSKLRSSNPFRNAKVMNKGRSSNSGRVAAKITRFNNVNYEIIGQKLTTFVHDVAELLPFNILRAASRSSNPLSNARAKSKGPSWPRLQTAPKFNWLP